MARLLLQDGTEYRGFHFGAALSASGEVVFNTAMTGYTESLTDPSYKGQLLVHTYPIIGNYGIPSDRKLENIHEFYESEKVHISALIVSDYSHNPNHWNMSYTLSHWLERNNVPGIYGIDTRSLTQKLRQSGSMLGKLIVDKDLPLYNPDKENLAAQVCVSDKTVYGNGLYKVLLVDCGVKNNILRCLLKRNCTVTRVSWDYDFTSEPYDGLFLSNGPGNPKTYQKTIDHLQYALRESRPIFGICLGHQLLGLAAGCDTYKLAYGHRGHNQPVLLRQSHRAYITSQNHGYVLNEKNLPEGWEVLFKNLNDNSCEGLIHRFKPFFSVQFHPEASGGPRDTEFLFDWFVERMEKYKAKAIH